MGDIDQSKRQRSSSTRTSQQPHLRRATRRSDPDYRIDRSETETSLPRELTAVQKLVQQVIKKLDVTEEAATELINQHVEHAPCGSNVYVFRSNSGSSSSNLSRKFYSLKKVIEYLKQQTVPGLEAVGPEQQEASADADPMADAAPMPGADPIAEAMEHLSQLQRTLLSAPSVPTQAVDIVLTPTADKPVPIAVKAGTYMDSAEARVVNLISSLSADLQQLKDIIVPWAFPAAVRESRAALFWAYGVIGSGDASRFNRMTPAEYQKLKSAGRKLLFQVHPDKHPQSEKVFWNGVAATASNDNDVTAFNPCELPRDTWLGAVTIDLMGKELEQSNSLFYTTRQELVEMIEDRNSLAKELNLAHERHAKTNASAMEIILQLQAQISQMLPLQQQLHSTQQQLHAVQLANKDQAAESEALKVRIGQVYALAAPKG
ncbi:hypothetical protein ABBQ38_006491 [Trebouxia sp. C0009 RCD-2024]